MKEYTYILRPENEALRNVPAPYTRMVLGSRLVKMVRPQTFRIKEHLPWGCGPIAVLFFLGGSGLFYAAIGDFPNGSSIRAMMFGFCLFIFGLAYFVPSITSYDIQSMSITTWRWLVFRQVEFVGDWLVVLKFGDAKHIGLEIWGHGDTKSPAGGFPWSELFDVASDEAVQIVCLACWMASGFHLPMMITNRPSRTAQSEAVDLLRELIRAADNSEVDKWDSQPKD